MAGVAAILVVGAACRPGKPAVASGALPQEAYLWQREWGHRVEGAIDLAPPEIGGFVVLAAEATLKPPFPRTWRAQYDAGALKAGGRPVGLALRLGAYPGPFRADDPTGLMIVDLARSVVADARAAGLVPSELEVDFDCAESKLEGYATWLAAIRDGVAPLPVAFTALPSWLDRREFEKLARVTGAFVLQVHSVEPPKGPDAPLRLCDPDRARRWVRQAARVGVPFRVALPTYGCWLSFAEDGRLLAIEAQDWVYGGPPAKTRRKVRADPVAMAALVRDWTRERPALMRGLIWYRLPTRSERLAWNPWTFRAVVAGREPRSAPLKLDVKKDAGGAFVLALVNEGETDRDLPKEVRVAWARAEWVGADSHWNYTWSREGASGIAFHRRTAEGDVPRQVAPGAYESLGWLRLKGDAELRTEVIE